MRAPLGVRGLSGGASSMGVLGRKSTARCVASGVRGWIFSRGRLWVGRSRHGDRGLQGGRWGALVPQRCWPGGGRLPRDPWSTGDQRRPQAGCAPQRAADYMISCAGGGVMQDPSCAPKPTRSSPPVR